MEPFVNDDWPQSSQEVILMRQSTIPEPLGDVSIEDTAVALCAKKEPTAVIAQGVTAPKG